MSKIHLKSLAVKRIINRPTAALFTYRTSHHYK